MSSSPRVSIVMPAHNAAAYVEEALAGILAQTLSDFEVIVVDDASTDATPDLLGACRDERVQVARLEEQAGICGALNHGLDLARGEYIARHDADDVSEPTRLQRQVEELDRRSEVGLLGTGMVSLSASGAVGGSHDVLSGPLAVRWAAPFGTPVLHPTVMLRASLVHQHGLRYDPSFEYAEDYELWVRILAYAEVDNVPETLVRYRRHAGQVSVIRASRMAELTPAVGLRAVQQNVPGLHVSLDDVKGLQTLVSGADLPATERARLASLLLDLLAAFTALHEGDPGLPRVIRSTVRLVAITAVRPGHDGARLTRRLARLDPIALATAPAGGLRARWARRSDE